MSGVCGMAFLCGSTLVKVPLLQEGTVAIRPQMFKSDVKPKQTTIYGNQPRLTLKKYCVDSVALLAIILSSASLMSPVTPIATMVVPSAFAFMAALTASPGLLVDTPSVIMIARFPTPGRSPLAELLNTVQYNHFISFKRRTCFSNWHEEMFSMGSQFLL